jgi:hypothetical protein
MAIPPPPPGFTLDAPQAGAAPPPPPGFTLDAQAPPAQAEQPQEKSFLQQLGRQAGLVGRDFASVAAAIPGIGVDTGIAFRNLGAILGRGELPKLADFNPLATEGGSRMEYSAPTADFQRLLTDVGVPEPTGAAEKTASFVRQAMLGGRIPGPQALKAQPAQISKQTELAGQAGANFKRAAKPATPAQETFEAGRKEGYVAPPSTVKPGPLLHLVESIGGKAATQQVASQKNQAVTNRLVRRELGIPEDAAITPKVLDGLRGNAGKTYAEVSRAGRIVPDAQYAEELAGLLKKSSDIAEDFPDANVASGKEIGDLVQSLWRGEFKASSALAYMKELRKQSSGNLSFINAADPAKKALGTAQREAAGALEDMVMRNLEQQGKGDLAKKFDDARRLIAKTYSVENALNPSTGNVAARDLATQLRKGKPISGGLKTAADFSGAFPKATEELRNSGPVSALDAIVAGGGAAMLDPTFIAYPLARMATREALLRPQVQNALVRRAGAGASVAKRNALAMGAAPALNQAGQ